MGGEDEIVRIARRLDKMVAKKNAVSGGGRAPAARLAWGAAPCPGLLSGGRAPSFPQDPLLAAALVDPRLSFGARCQEPPSPQTPFWEHLFQCRPAHYIVLEQTLSPLKWGSLAQAPSPSPVPILCGGVGSTHCHLPGGQPYVPLWVLWHSPVPMLSPRTPGLRYHQPASQHSGAPPVNLSLRESIPSPAPLSRWEPFGRGVPISTGWGSGLPSGKAPVLMDLLPASPSHPGTTAHCRGLWSVQGWPSCCLHSGTLAGCAVTRVTAWGDRSRCFSA